MKKSLLLAFLPLFTLVSCTNPAANSEVNTSEEATTKEKQYPASVLNSEWGLEAAKASYDVLGLAIPYISNDSFSYEAGVDDYGDPDIWFYCFYSSDEAVEKAFTDYVAICQNKGFSGSIETTRYVDYDTFTIYEFDVCYCDRIIKDATGTKEFGVELQFLVSYKDEKPCLGIYGFTYVYCPDDQFPTAALDKLYGENGHEYVPTISGEGYEYAFKFDIYDESPYLIINVYNASYEIEEEYYNALKNTHKFDIGYSNDSLDEAYYADEYLGFEDENYYIAMYNNIYIYFDYDLADSIFILEFYVIN